MCHIITSLSKKELFIHVKFDLEKIKQQIAVYRGREGEARGELFQGKKPPTPPKPQSIFYTSQDGLSIYTVSHLHSPTAIVLQVYLKSFERLSLT